ncbi:RfbB dTDP-D-glucose 4,6-dehydratase [Candidatus Nanopelagicaceae bacterium]|jgi:dTDP-glucose 4,6-dehydratase
MKIVVTGGAGFIGSEMVRQLSQSENQLVVIDSLTYAGNLDSISPVLDKVGFEKIDIRDNSAINDYFANSSVDCVVNFAAETHVDNSIASPEIFLETNILGTFNLLEAARKYKFRFLQVSTDEVYGSIREGEFKESDKLDPSSPYSASKASAELLLQAYVTTYSVEALGVRCSNNYGYYQNREKLIPAFIDRMIRGEKLPVYGTGKNVREWIHVSDSVAGIVKVLNAGKVGEFYNISSQDFQENIEVTRKIIEFFNGDESCIEYVEDRLGHDFRYAIDSSKIRTELDWVPLIRFEEGLAETIQWYLDNPDFLHEKKQN